MASSSAKEKEFLVNYERLKNDFDGLAEDYFAGKRLEEIASAFYDKNKEFMMQVPHTITNCKYPNCSNLDGYEEDMKIVSELPATGADGKKGPSPSSLQQAIGGVYRRLSQACYLRLTFNFSRSKEDGDRQEAVRWAQNALRYDPGDFWIAYWYMIAFGWLVEATKNVKERLIMGQVFYKSILYCIRLNPKEPLAHNLLARYYYAVAELSWIEKTVASGVLGHKLKGSYEEAEQALLISHQARDWLPNGLWMARVLMGRQRPQAEVEHWIDFGLALEAREPTTEIEREELLALREKLKSQRSK